MRVEDYSLPAKFQTIHPHQADAIEEVVEQFEAGAEVVWLNAPTGSGKTLIAEVVRQEGVKRGWWQSTTYTCTDKTLQDQFSTEFPYSRVLKGRANYPTELKPWPQFTCGDCTGKGCWWCEGKLTCPYEVAKREAMFSDLAVVNTAYLLAECNYTGQSVLSGRDFTIVDECDMLEQSLMGFVEFKVTPRQLERLGLVAPKKSVHYTTIVSWLGDTLYPELKMWVQGNGRMARTQDVREVRVYQSMKRLLQATEGVLVDLEVDLDNWVRDPGEEERAKGGLVMKPIRVSKHGRQVLWRHSKRWLCMSATVISPSVEARSLGVEEE